MFDITDVYIIHSFFPEAFLFCQKKPLTGILYHLICVLWVLAMVLMRESDTVQFLVRSDTVKYLL